MDWKYWTFAVAKNKNQNFRYSNFKHKAVINRCKSAKSVPHQSYITQRNLKIQKMWNFGKFYQNIARGTTDPGIASITWLSLYLSSYKAGKFSRKKIQHSIGSNFDHQVALKALFPNLPTRWRHFPWLQICISSKFGHQMAPLALVRLGKIEARVTSF